MAGQGRYLASTPPRPDVYVPVPRLRLCAPPTLAELAERGLLSTKPTSGLVPADEWECKNNKYHTGRKPVINYPTNNLLLNLPPLYCTGCKRTNPFAYGWKVPLCTLNHVPLRFLIRNQGEFDTCVAHAILAALDMQRGVDSALFSEAETKQALNILDLFHKYSDVFGVPFSEEHESPHTEHLALHRAACIFFLLQQYGVKYAAPKAATIPRRVLPQHHIALQVLDVFRISSLMLEHIVMLLANGFALVTGLPTGRAFTFTSSAAGPQIHLVGDGDQGSISQPEIRGRIILTRRLLFLATEETSTYGRISSLA
ncbi:uncharacterized protein LOC100832377 isoform X2 [Brachypodium distachyon]|uniref:uncharacterized protein LOC100832377 isoform X2 n=1 Tax=Brachypodium distachyon TaxID=15368 RepID=UPI000D0C985C|nr:uncharacterized protein LOC100832377 isoform X2 [Brachypodium distachyon]|eukprot:XP_024315751.1 uncharacterized protein LOC100832377 isoform X2 [Brachypodium distachyon]